jgi:hypothetical protein
MWLLAHDKSVKPFVDVLLTATPSTPRLFAQPAL